MTEDQVYKFIDECPDKTISLVVETIFFTALRIHELCNMRFDWLVKIDKNWYEIDIPGKTNEQSVRIPIELVNRIQKHCNSENYIFEHNYKGEKKAYSSTSFSNRIFKHTSKILDKGYFAHSIRHSSLSYLYRESKDLKKVSLLARHSDISLTASQYLHEEFSNEELNGYFKKLLKV